MKIDKSECGVDGSLSKYDEWKARLTAEQYRILRCRATEAPFTGKYWNNHDTGEYLCAGCGAELFKSGNKFDSGSGWPSFTGPVKEGVVVEKRDGSHGLSRTEVICSNCDGHLGHVFDDGPGPVGLRYCINSGALAFKPQVKVVGDAGSALDLATFGGGCFWCTEAAFESVSGVKDVKVGFMGGHKVDPSYKDVCRGDTGHIEVSQLTYDPGEVRFSDLLEVFWKIHDATSVDRQGADEGTQYRSAIFWHSERQKVEAEQGVADLEKKIGRKVVTSISKAEEFYPAEGYHQDYFRKNPDAGYCRGVIAPKLKKLSESGLPVWNGPVCGALLNLDRESPSDCRPKGR